MRLVGVDEILWALGFLGQLALIATLLKQRMSSVFPIFTAYIAVSAIGDPIGYWVHQAGNVHALWETFFSLTLIDYALQLLVLFEIMWIVFRPRKHSRSNGNLWLLPVAILLSIIAGIWLASSHPDPESISSQILSVFLHITLGLVLIRILCFVMLSGFAQMLGIGWKSHILQLTTGFAFYGLVTMVVQFLIDRWHRTMPFQEFSSYYHTLNRFQIGAYLATLAFWIWSFSQNEAPRKEFSPQMQAFLVSIAGTARSARLVVTRGTGR
jgi:hypothetical protein